MSFIEVMVMIHSHLFVFVNQQVVYNGEIFLMRNKINDS